MDLPDDVRDNLKVLPESLTDMYDEIYNRILKQSRRASQLALNAFRWVQCSYEPLKSETLLDAVTVEVGGSGEFSHRDTAVRANDLLKVCQNLLILDERLNVFRFAHLSVEEYLETQQPKVDSHTEIAKVCLSLVCSSGSWTDYDTTIATREGRYHDRHLLLYSAVFWPWHLNRCEDSCQTLAALWEAFLSEATFQHWIDYHCNRVRTAGAADTFWRRSNELQRQERGRLSTVCMFGLGRKITSISKSQFGWTACIKLKFPTTFITETEQKGCVHRLLVHASQFGDLDIAQHLLDAGVGVSAMVAAGYDEGRTPLHFAAARGHEAVARLLLDRGADVSAVVADGYGEGGTPLHFAAVSGHEAVARLLLDRGADVSAVVAAGYGEWVMPLHFAAARGHEAVARLLLDRGADVSAVVAAGYDEGETPLHFAAVNGHEAVARLLLDRGADVSAVAAAGYDEGRTPLHLAAENGHEAVARLLLDRGADVSVVAAAGYYEGRAPLHIAAERGHEAVARLLSAATAPPSS